MNRRIVAALLGGITLAAAAAVVAPVAMSAGATKAPFYTVTNGTSDERDQHRGRRVSQLQRAVG